jgi:2-polyprenyl-6-hydroxyphenyl methylase/3-demethylubiquinone-9 3-methyltransferase
MEVFSEYRYADRSSTGAHSYLWPRVNAILDATGARKIFEIGCGNGATARMLSQRGYSVVGVDPSVQGIAQANDPNLHVGSADDDLATMYGRFPVVLSVEVIEHCFQPRAFARNCIRPVGARRHGGHLNSVSWILEEPCIGVNGANGRPLHGPLGRRPHQVLVREDAPNASCRSGF